MSTTIECEFPFKSCVLITELGLSGIVVAVLWDRDGVLYKVRYFHEKSAKEVYFFFEELTAVTSEDGTPKMIGFVK